MPFRWERGENPFIHNYFGKLSVGPNTPPGTISQQAKNLAQKLVAGGTIELAGVKLDEYEIKQAPAQLREPRSWAEELLLVHPQASHDQKGLKATAEKLRQIAVLPEDHEPLPLLHPLALFWFTPSPGPEAAELPEWGNFGLIEPGSETDLVLDIVFDC